LGYEPSAVPVSLVVFPAKRDTGGLLGRAPLRPYGAAHD